MVGFADLIAELRSLFNPPTVLEDGTKAVTTAGTRERLSENTLCKQVIITAKADNTGYVYVGGPLVSSTRYMKQLSAGDAFSVVVNNLNVVFLDVSVSGEGVTYGYLR